jgi:WD40 repeat protein
MVAANALGGEMVLWDRTTGEKHLTARGVAYAFAPDSRSLAMTGPDGALTLIDTETGLELWKSDLGPRLRPASFAFSPDGATIIAAWGGVLRFFETASGRERLGSPEVHQGSVSLVRYTPAGDTLLTAGDDGAVRQWDAMTARQLRVIPHGSRVHLLAVSPDGRSLATATLMPVSSVRVWDVETSRLRQEWVKNSTLTGAEALTFSPDGELVLFYSPVQGLQVREVVTGRERTVVQPQFGLAKKPGPASGMIAAIFSPGNQFLAVRTRSTAHVADLATGMVRFSTPSEAMAFSPDGRSLAVATPG